MIKRAVNLLLVLVVLSGCRQPVDAPVTRSQVISSEPVREKSESQGKVSSWPARYTELQHKLVQGHYADVAREAEQAYNATFGRDRFWAWRFRLLQAQATSRKLESKTALALVKMDPPPGLPINDLVRKEIVIAEAQITLKRPDEALAALNRAKAILPSASADPVLNSEWLLWRGKCEPFTSEASHGYFIQAARMARGHSKFIEAGSEVNIGFGLFQRQRFDEAIDHLKVALVLAKEKELDSPVLEELSLSYMAQSYFQLGDYPKAEQYARSAERLADILGIVHHRMRRLIDLGLSQQILGNYAEATNYYLQAMSLARKGYDTQDEDARSESNDVIVRCLGNMAEIELRQGNLDKVEEYSRQATALAPLGDQAFLWQVRRVNLALARKQHESAQEMLMALLAEKNLAPRLRWVAQDRMGRVYEDLGQTNNADRWYRMAVDSGIAVSDTFNHQEYKISFLSNLPVYNDYIEFLIRSKQPIRALRMAESGRSKVLAKTLGRSPDVDDASAWLASVQSELARSSKVALAYWMSDAQLYIWVITGSQIQLVQQPHGAAELLKLVAAYHKEIEGHNKVDESPAAVKLYQILVQPVQSYLPENARTVIVADGILYDINFESLIASEPKLHYWIEDVEVENAIALQQVITSGRREPSYEKELLAIGAPVQASQEFSLLPHAPAEIRLVTSTFAPEQQRVIVREQATPQAFFNSNPGSYRYIHFVAHGTKVSLEPLDSAIILSPDENHSYKLYARDIANLKHPLRAQVVTISSCDSAGVFNYEMGGLIGLSWAFTHAGAKQVVAALWKVEDATMPDLMGNFYKEMAQGKSTSKALRDAKLSFLHSTSARKRPYYWATLQLYSGS